MVLTRSSPIQTRNKKRSKTTEIELSSTRKQRQEKQASSYQSLSKTSKAKLSKLSNDRMAKASQLKKLKINLKRKSTNYNSLVIGPSDDSLKDEVKNEVDSEDEEEMTDQPPNNDTRGKRTPNKGRSKDDTFAIKNEIVEDEPEEVESIAQNVTSEEMDVMSDLLQNYIRMVAIDKDKFTVSFNPLMAILHELSPNQFYELVEILRDTDFLVKNADVVRTRDSDKPGIAFNCKVIHKNNIFKEEKRVLVKATLIKGKEKLREMLRENPELLDSDISSDETDLTPLEKRLKKNRRNRLMPDNTKKSPPCRPKRMVTDFDRPRILKRTQPIRKEVPHKVQEEKPPQPPKMFNLDNTGKLITEKTLPAYSLTKGPTPATALSASERLKLRKEMAARASEKVILKKLLYDVDLDANKEPPLQPVPVVRRYPSYVCLPLSSGVPTIIAPPKEPFR